MNKRITVSIIIPVFQITEYIERCVRSVMAQTYTDIECIIVDDATEDDSVAKCERLIREYEGPICFRILHHEKNRGLSAARNTGTEAARGEWLFYLDGDDFIVPDCIEQLVVMADYDPTIEMVQGNLQITSCDRGSKLYRQGKAVEIRDNEKARKAFFKDRIIYISVWNKLIKRSFVEECGLYCREGLVLEDVLWVFYLIKNLEKAYLCERVTYYYCKRPGSITTTANSKTLGCYAIIFHEILQNLTPEHEKEEIEGYLYFFIKRYFSYVSVVPTFKETFRLYKVKAKQYHCWYVFFMLYLTGIIGYIGNPLAPLEWMNDIRWRLKKCKLV